MKQEPQHFGDAVEHNRARHEEAHRRARERNDNDPREDRGGEHQPMPANDFNAYSEAERAPAAPAHDATLSWGGGDPRLVPQVLEREEVGPNTPFPDGRGGALFGVDAIVNGRK